MEAHGLSSNPCWKDSLSQQCLASKPQVAALTVPHGCMDSAYDPLGGKRA
jgi:hypothetical protein